VTISDVPAKKEINSFLTGAQHSHLQRVTISDAPVKKEFSSFLTGAQDSHLQTVTIPQAAYIQLQRRPSEDEQGNARNMQRILINVLYVNK
jgi:hypothetical protein